MKEKPQLSPQFWQDLADNNPIGMKLSADDARAWFDYVWLSYRERRYTRHRLAIISWWSRVSEEEIEGARDRAARIAEESTLDRMEDRGSKLHPSDRAGMRCPPKVRRSSG